MKDMTACNGYDRYMTFYNGCKYIKNKYSLIPNVNIPNYINNNLMYFIYKFVVSKTRLMCTKIYHARKTKI